MTMRRKLGSPVAGTLCAVCRRVVSLADSRPARYCLGELGPLSARVCVACYEAIKVKGPVRRSTIAGEVTVGLVGQ
jgi:hypothetical protein